jgi:hypothetical protein
MNQLQMEAKQESRRQRDGDFEEDGGRGGCAGEKDEQTKQNLLSNTAGLSATQSPSQRHSRPLSASQWSGNRLTCTNLVHGNRSDSLGNGGGGNDASPVSWGNIPQFL